MGSEVSARFSAIIPVRQSGEEKALAATMSNLCFAGAIPIELVVVSDGPSETNRAVCEAAQRLNLLHDEFNPAATIVYDELPERTGHGSHPRNRGVELSTGEWVHFADAGTGYVGGFYNTISQAADAKTMFWGCVVLRHPYPYILPARPGDRLGDGTLFCPAGIQGAVWSEVAKAHPWGTSYFCDRDWWGAVKPDSLTTYLFNAPLCIAYGNLDNNDHHGKPFRGELDLGGRYPWAD